MPKYIATTPIKHDGKRYGVGDKLTLDPGEAKALLAAGALEDARESAAERKAAADKAEAERKAAQEEADAAQAAAAAAAAATGPQGGNQPN